MDQLDRFGLKYARAYALTFFAPSPTVSWPHHPRDRVAGPPQGLSARCALLIRQIVLEEIQTGGN